MFKKILLVSILMVLLGCQQDKGTWNPVFKETNFDYINFEIERSLLLMDEAYSVAKEGKQHAIEEKRTQAKMRLFEIKNYYVPLTTARQKIYDAERFFKMITQVILTFNTESKPDTYDKIKKAGEHINLMLFKGDIVLSGIKFEK